MDVSMDEQLEPPTPTIIVETKLANGNDIGSEAKITSVIEGKMKIQEMEESKLS